MIEPKHFNKLLEKLTTHESYLKTPEGLSKIIEMMANDINDLENQKESLYDQCLSDALRDYDADDDLSNPQDREHPRVNVENFKMQSNHIIRKLKMLKSKYQTLKSFYEEHNDADQLSAKETLNNLIFHQLYDLFDRSLDQENFPDEPFQLNSDCTEKLSTISETHPLTFDIINDQIIYDQRRKP